MWPESRLVGSGASVTRLHFLIHKLFLRSIGIAKICKSWIVRKSYRVPSYRLILPLPVSVLCCIQLFENLWPAGQPQSLGDVQAYLSFVFFSLHPFADIRGAVLDFNSTHFAA